MTRHSMNNNTGMGLVIPLCSNSNHLISYYPPNCLNFSHLLSCGTIGINEIEIDLSLPLAEYFQLYFGLDFEDPGFSTLL